MNKPTEYLCQIDSGIIPIIDSTWTLLDTGATVWLPTVSTLGIITLTSGATELNSTSLLGMDGKIWNWDISTGGILSYEYSLIVTVATTHDIAALQDNASVTWLLLVNLNGELVVTTENPLENKYYYPAIQISFEIINDTDTFELHAIKPNTTMHRR